MSNDSIFKEVVQFRDELLASSFNSVEDDSIEEIYSYGNNIYQLFDGLLNLFKELNLLSESGDPSPEKFRFIHAYPDEVKDAIIPNIVTYNIVKRNPRVTANSSINTRSVTKYSPSVVGELYNPITGNVEEQYKLEFDNVVAITIFSKKARVLNNLARLIESIFLKYSSYIKKFVDMYIYLGMSDIRYLDKYEDQDPLYCRELQFRVMTTETYKQELEHIKSINLQLN